MTLVWHLLSNRWNSAITEYALSCALACELAGAQSVFSPLEGSPGERRAAKAGLRVVSLRSFGGGPTNRQYLDQLRQLRPDLVIAYGGPETFLAKASAGARVVRFRGQGVGDDWLTRLRHKLSHRHVSLQIAPSAALAAKLRRMSPAESIHHVVLGVDNTKFCLPEPVAPRRSPPEIVLLGRLDPVKGHRAAFALHRALLDRWREPFPAPLLHVVGEPANLSTKDLEHAAADAGLCAEKDYKITARRVENVPDLLAGAALGLVSSIGSEIIGRVAEEFLLCGTPVALSGVGSLEELLFDGAGFSYRGLSQDETASRLNEWVLRSMAENGAARQSRANAAYDRYSLSTMAGELKRILCLSRD